MLQPLSSAALECPFSAKEIKAAVWNCEGNKAPGSDGVNFFFIKKAWSTIGGDITRMVQEFYQSNVLPLGINSSFVTLFPKINYAIKLADFRPISLVGSLYKIISKMLAIRLKHVMPEVITDNQTAFIKGRQILDSVLIANEAIAYIKAKQSKAYLFKLYFHKAFDSVLWEYINEVMLVWVLELDGEGGLCNVFPQQRWLFLLMALPQRNSVWKKDYAKEILSLLFSLILQFRD